MKLGWRRGAARAVLLTFVLTTVHLGTAHAEDKPARSKPGRKAGGKGAPKKRVKSAVPDETEGARQARTPDGVPPVPSHAEGDALSPVPEVAREESVKAPPPAAAAAGSEASPDAAATSAAAPMPRAPLPGEPPSLVQNLARPWASGVSVERQQEALKMLLDGNVFLRESLFVEAVKKYRGALAAWDHPGIHYNLAVALLNLDQPLEVHAHLESALRYGAAPLDADKFEHARSYRVLVEKQLAPLEVKCDLHGATVALDGEKLFISPGAYKGLVRPGPHTITATKEGYPTTERTKILLPGQPTTLNLRLYSEGELIEYRRRWPLWKPVAVTAGGAALLVGAVVLTFAARDRFDRYDSTIKMRPECATGCLPDAELSNLKDRGETFQTLATIGYIAGSVVLAGGIALLSFDRATPYRIEPEQRQALLVPLVGPGTLGVAGSTTF